MRLFKHILKVIGVLLGVCGLFYVPFYFLVIYHTKITDDSISTYQFRELTILYISSCVTTLALIVALLKDEIRSLWRRAKIEIKSKSINFIIEKPYDITGASDVRAEFYNSILYVINTGSLHINLCSISLTKLQYKSFNGNPHDIDVSLSEDIKWLGKNNTNTPIHSNGGKAEALVIQFKTNDAGTTGESQSQPAKLYIGGFEATKGHNASQGSVWTATFTVYFDTSRPVDYSLEISWDGEWHNRLPEMLEHCKIREVNK